MRKSLIFVSCGQFTEAEKRLGLAIVKTIESTTDFNAFFAEDVQDLDGLNNNILRALRECAGLIVILHPRGEIVRPNGSKHIRASVWIEQEIAIAAYIRGSEKRPLPVIAFSHKSVGREGIRDLLQLSPKEFSEEAEVLALLPSLLASWKTLSPTGISLELTSDRMARQDAHAISRLNVLLKNESNERITNYDGVICFPTNILKHWNQHYWHEQSSDDPSLRKFLLNEKNTGSIPPHHTANIYFVDYCMQCGVDASGGSEEAITNALVRAQIWIGNREYRDEKTLLALRPDGEI